MTEAREAMFSSGRKAPRFALATRQLQPRAAIANARRSGEDILDRKNPHINLDQ